MEDKKRFGMVIAAIGAVTGLLGFVFYKLFPKIMEKCCPPKKKKK
jgi:hypothetical protein